MPDPVLDRVDQQIHWYDRHATSARIWYCSIKIAQIILAAAVPVAAGLDLPKLLTGSLGGLIVVLEGIQQLFRYHDNWVRYRWTASAMEREKSLWTARAGDYATAERPEAQLALRIEDLTSREATQWVALQLSQTAGTSADAEAKPTDAGPAEAKPADAMPADGRPADARPADARPADDGIRPPDPAAPPPAQPDDTAPAAGARA